jgi:hypothetical protein
MQLAYTVVMSGGIFNWGAIIAKQINTQINQTHNFFPGQVPSF